MKRKSNLLATLGLLLVATSLSALTPDEWRNRQPFEIDRAGPIKFALPAAALDTAQADLRDLRIIDAGGKETPYLLLQQPTAVAGRKFPARKFRAELSDDATTVLIETGTTQPLELVELETSARSFIKPVLVEFSDDGETWHRFDNHVPIFRQDEAAKTAILLAQSSTAYIRLTISDEQSRPIAITGASLQSASTRPEPAEPLAIRIVRTEEFTGETVVILDLGAAHLSLASLDISADDPLFARNVSITTRELRDGQFSERPLARGTIYRIDLDASNTANDPHVLVNTSIPTRELLVHIENGDSPALQIRGIQARFNPIFMVVAPIAPGRFEILTGNTQSSSPRYDLAALGNQLGQLPVATVRIGESTTNSSYRQADPLAGLALEGAVLDTSAWAHQRAVNTTKPGVQQIELDLHALANARADLADLRLIQAGKQLPYLIEHTGLCRDMLYTPVELPDPKRPSVSRWKFPIPNPGTPVSKLIISSPTKLFDRSLRVYEVLQNQVGETYEHTLASKPWLRTLSEKPQPLAIALTDRLQTKSLWIETDNGDNPPLKLDRLQAFVPVIRLICKTDGGDPIDLVYGNSAASAPRYDLSLVSNALLNSSRSPATLGSVQTVTPSSNLLQGAHSGVIFWAVLALVVVLLLIIVAKLLPKPGSK